MRRSIAAVLLTLPMVGLAWAEPPLAADETQEPQNAPYITGTGATVPNPGQSQSAGTTRLDRRIERQDNKIDKSICKGC